MKFSLDYKNNFETLSIKKNNLGNYVLYGLIWLEMTVDDVPTKMLCSIKSDDLIWKYNINFEQNIDYTYIYGGYSKSPLYKFASSIVRKLLYNFTFENINSKDVMVEITVLNGKKDEFMYYNIYEGLDNYIVKINVAGVKREEIKIILEDEIVKVKINPKKEELEDMEIMCENFKPVKSECEIFLPNVLNVEAELKDGILILTAPKESKGVKIEIK